MKRSLLRPQAEGDLVARTRYYRSESGPALAERFFNAALVSLRPIERMPGIGSLRIGELSDIPGLRDWPVQGFPVRWLYFETDTNLDVVRLIADTQDLLAILRAAE